MIVGYGEYTPDIDPNAWVAADATVCGNVTIGAGCRIMHGARLVAEAGGLIRVGCNCIVLENAVIRATANHPCAIGDHCLFGPNSHVVGAEIGDEVFIATGPPYFTGLLSRTERRSGSTAQCICAAGSKRAPSCRSAGSPWATRPRSCRRTIMKPSGRYKSRWIFRASSMVLTATHLI